MDIQRLGSICEQSGCHLPCTCCQSGSQGSERYDDIFVFVPEMRQVIRIAEGDGSNLLPEDIEEGYVDYIYYEQYEIRTVISEVDGGQILLEEMFRDKYRCMADCIPDVLDMAYGGTIGSIILA